MDATVINNAANNAFFYYVWDFGDNTGAFSGSPTHQYANFGSYVICLTALIQLIIVLLPSVTQLP